jgi:predicted MFS family arabinose efflux permease
MPPEIEPRIRAFERRIIFLIGAVQFINILDFMMVMPLGPDFARSLGIPTSKLGYIGGSYTLAAAFSGLIGSFFLDRFDRRPALAISMLGLALGTAAGGLAHGMVGLMAARVLAGIFGGPATSISLSIVADVIPRERRGKALGAVMGAFSVASVLGVPAGLQLALWGGWRTPFFVVATMGILITAGAAYYLPELRAHITADGPQERPSLGALFARPVVRFSYLMTATVMMSGFILIPNFSAYFQGNLGYPRARLGLLYAIGGTVSFATMRFVGWLVDRNGSFRIGTLGSGLLILVLYLGFLTAGPVLPPLAIFVSFMFAMSFRNISYNTLTSMVPHAAERARFMSIQSAVQHAASATGAFLSARLLTEIPDRRLVGMPRLVLISMALTVTLPLLLYLVEHRIERGPEGVEESGAKGASSVLASA